MQKLSSSVLGSIKAKAGSSLPSFVEGDVGGKGRPPGRCATAPAHPTLVLTHWHSLAPHPFMATKSRQVHVDLCEVYTVYMGLCMYRYTLSTYIYRGEREREREREREQKTFPTSSNHRHSTAQPIFGLWRVRFPPVLVRTGRRPGDHCQCPRSTRSKL